MNPPLFNHFIKSDIFTKKSLLLNCDFFYVRLKSIGFFYPKCISQMNKKSWLCEKMNFKFRWWYVTKVQSLTKMSVATHLKSVYKNSKDSMHFKSHTSRKKHLLKTKKLHERWIWNDAVENATTKGLSILTHIFDYIEWVGKNPNSEQFFSVSTSLHY